MADLLLEGRSTVCQRILDPAVGPATFPRSLAENPSFDPKSTVVAYDLDTDMVRACQDWAHNHRVNFLVHSADYLEEELPPSFDGAILNPPYLRQEWIDNKSRYRSLFKSRYGVTIPGTSNLYVYFVVKALMELKRGGRLVCIIYDSWQSTRFGQWMLALLTQYAKDIECESVQGQPFRGRLIDTTILRASRNGSAPSTRPVAVVPNRAVTTPLADVDGTESIDRLFVTKRGLRLKQANFFLCARDDVDRRGATPFVKKVARISGYLVPADHPEAALLISPGSRPAGVRKELGQRLKLALTEPEKNESILTWYRERPRSWFMHAKPPHAPLLFNYYLRSRPRHILNPSYAYSDNFYGLVPRDQCEPLAALAILNSSAACAEILSHARNQGNGLAKVQLFEYRRVRVPDWNRLSRSALAELRGLGLQLLSPQCDAASTIARIDQAIYAELSQPALHPSRMCEALCEADRTARQPRSL